jgi:hypothetical protein
MSALGPVAPDGLLGLLVSGSAGVAVYLGSLVGLGAIGREDVALLRALVPTRISAAADRES